LNRTPFSRLPVGSFKCFPSFHGFSLFSFIPTALFFPHWVITAGTCIWGPAVEGLLCSPPSYQASLGLIFFFFFLGPTLGSDGLVSPNVRTPISHIIHMRFITITAELALLFFFFRICGHLRSVFPCRVFVKNPSSLPAGFICFHRLVLTLLDLWITFCINPTPPVRSNPPLGYKRLVRWVPSCSAFTHCTTFFFLRGLIIRNL